MRCRILILVISHFLNLFIYQRNLNLAEQLKKKGRSEIMQGEEKEEKGGEKALFEHELPQFIP